MLVPYDFDLFVKHFKNDVVNISRRCRARRKTRDITTEKPRLSR